MKKIATLLFSILFILAACGNAESEKKEKEKTKITQEQQEKKHNKETKKLAQSLIDNLDKEELTNDDIKTLEKDLKTFENNTKSLKQVDTIISDPIYKAAKSFSIAGKDINKTEKFKEKYPELENTYLLSNGNVYYHLILTLNTINNEYEDVDIEYKNKVLGKELNSDISDMIFSDDEISDFAEQTGKLAIEYDEKPTDEQLKELPDTKYRDELKKYAYFDEPDVSKKEYNKLVEDYNKLTPEFLHYKKSNELVSADENLSMSDLRNGVVGAKTDSEVEDYSDDTEETEDTSQENSSNKTMGEYDTDSPTYEEDENGNWNEVSEDENTTDEDDEDYDFGLDEDWEKEQEEISNR